MAVDITLGNGNNQGTFTTFDSLTTGSGNDVITVTDALTAGTINLGGGNDALTLGDAVNTVTISGVETFTGGASADDDNVKK